MDLDYTFLLDYFYEKGIVSIILDYKILFEDYELISNYNFIWYNISKFIINTDYKLENFIIRYEDKINFSMIFKNNSFSDNFFINYMDKLTNDEILFYLSKNNINIDIIIQHKLFLLPEFFFYYYLMKNKENIDLLNTNDLYILISEINEHKEFLTNYNLNFFKKTLLKILIQDIKIINYILYKKKNDIPENIRIAIDNLFTYGDRKKELLLNIVSQNINIKWDINFLEKHQKLMLWNNISKNKHLTEKIINKFCNLISWGYLSLNYPFNDFMLIKYYNYINLDNLSNNKYTKLNKHYIILHLNKKQINNRLKLQNVDSEIYDFNKYNISWKNICLYQDLSYDYINKNKELIYWDLLIKNKKISFEILNKFTKYINFDLLIKYRNLPENFLNKFKKKLDWDLISKYQINLSRDFLKKHKRKINWETAKIYQKNISLDMIIKYCDN